VAFGVRFFHSWAVWVVSGFVFLGTVPGWGLTDSARSRLLSFQQRGWSNGDDGPTMTDESANNIHSLFQFWWSCGFSMRSDPPQYPRFSCFSFFCLLFFLPIVFFPVSLFCDSSLPTSLLSFFPFFSLFVFVFCVCVSSYVCVCVFELHVCRPMINHRVKHTKLNT